MPTFRTIDETTKAACIRLRHSAQAYVVDANDSWGNEYIPRFNKSFVRFTVPDGPVGVQAVVTTSNDLDTTFAVVQDGALFGSFSVANDGIRRRVDIQGLTPGSTVEIWEPFSGVFGSPVNNGLDRPKANGYIEGLWLAPGVSTPTRPTTTGTCIVTFGTSIQSACTDRTPQIFDGAIGQFRLLAHAKGWLVGSLDYGAGTLLGDGPSMAQRAADCIAVYQASGASALTVLLGDCRNDWAYYNQAGVLSTPNDCRDGYTALIAAIKSSVPAAKIVLCTPIPQTTETSTGAGTLGQYRTAVATAVGADVVLDGTSFGIVTGTDLGDGVHMNHLGVAKYVDGVKDSLDL